MSVFDLMERFKGFKISKFLLIEEAGAQRWITPAEWKSLKDNPDVSIVKNSNDQPMQKAAVGIHYKDKDEFDTYWIDIWRVDPYKES